LRRHRPLSSSARRGKKLRQGLARQKKAMRPEMMLDALAMFEYDYQQTEYAEIREELP
jgi:hypothetical protein